MNDSSIGLCRVRAGNAELGNGTRSWEIGAGVPMSLAPMCLARVSYDPSQRFGILEFHTIAYAIPNAIYFLFNQLN